jgi:hypothetical protein
MKKSNFEKACAELGIATTLPGVEGLPEADAKSIIAFYKLNKIADATGKRATDFSDGKLKYTAWLTYSPASGCFVLGITDYTSTLTCLGARFWFTDRTTARKFFEENAELVNELHQA